jgi:hypothetical protein
MKDMAQKGRAYHTTGEKNGNCKLTTQQVKDIRNDNRRNYIIAKEYKVSKSTITQIKKYQTRIIE